MEMSEGNSLYSSLKQMKKSFFFFHKILPWGLLILVGREEIGKECGRMIMV
jgi:hypothetical protein